MPVIPVNRVVDKKRMIGKNGGLRRRKGTRPKNNNFVSNFRYWTWDKSTVPCCILARSMGFAVFYHLVNEPAQILTQKVSWLFYDIAEF
jgi:hypothetical protein